MRGWKRISGVEVKTTLYTRKEDYKQDEKTCLLFLVQQER